MTQRYRILHIAAHGVFEEDINGRTQTGIVIGGDRVLAPGVINQLTNVPDLVFLNCCHIGRVVATSEKLSGTRYHQLAANIATQFIKIGVRAVIAAGWAVDDDAAMSFARSFYEAMAHGKTFGSALRHARKVVYQGFPGSDTWGAYQAYGDPGFRLREGEHDQSTTDRFISPQELLVELQNIESAAQVTSDPASSDLLQRLQAAKAILDQNWPKNSELQAALGQAAGELDQFATAIDAYGTAFKAARANASVRSMEQLINLQARSAVAVAKGRAAVGGKSAVELVDQALDQLDKMIGLFGESTERYSLQGSAFKRKAQIVEPGDTLDTIKDMAEAYAKAYELAQSEQYYPLGNWLLAASIIELRGGKQPPKIAKDKDWMLDAIREAEAAAAAKDQNTPDFWSGVAAADLDLVRILIERNDEISVSPIVDGYQSAWDRGGSPNKLRSVIEHYDFIIHALSEGSRNRDLMAIRKRILGAMQRIRNELVTLAQSEHH